MPSVVQRQDFTFKVLAISVNTLCTSLKQENWPSFYITGAVRIKAVLVSMITSFGLAPGGYSDDIHCQLTMEDLFR